MCRLPDPTDRGPGPTTALVVAEAGWQALVLGTVANFAVLRRRVGRQRSDQLMAQIAGEIARIVPDAGIVVTGRNQIELSLRESDPVRPEAMLDRIDELFRRPVTIDGEDHAVELVLGGAVAAVGRCDEVRLIEDAEQALVDARREHRIVVRRASGDAGGVDRIALAHDLHHAICAGELFLHYQPKLHMRRQRISSVEALIRWRHPVRGLVQPNDFIPLAEESRDIVALTLWTIQQVIADQRILRDQGHDLTIFINIAGVLLADGGFVRQVAALLDGSDASLGFEITETSVIRDPTSAIANLQTFAEMGITIAIDDYGAGLSSLAYLKQLPARELKIDKLFVTQLTSSNRDPLIVRSTIDLAHAMEMEVVAEGVETQAALALLSVMGCDMVQGFLISRPIALEPLIAFLSEERDLTATPDPRQMLNRLKTAWRAA